MRRSTGSLTRYLAPVIILLMSLTCLALRQGSACAAPTVPAIVSPVYGAIDASTNPTLQASAYSGPGFTHKATAWQVAETSDFNASIVWSRISTEPETQTVVSRSTGLFSGDQTALDMNVPYWVRVCYQDSNDDWSDFSDTSLFITATTTWYLAEGCTDGGMETWLLVQNPGDIDAIVSMDFMTDEGLVPGPRDTIPPGYRKSYNAGAYVTSYNVSTKVSASQGTIVCERAVYGNNRSWGHDSIGVTSMDNSWFFAEGCTDGGMETWLLVQNPNDFQVIVNIGLYTDTGLIQPPELQFYPIPANSRRSFNIGDYVQTYNVSISVGSTGDDITNSNIICERAMYGNNREWAHDSIGAMEAKSSWFFAEGCSDGGMETWVLIQNQARIDQSIMVYLMDENGQLGYIPILMPAESRFSLNLGDFVQSYNVATVVLTVDENGNYAEDGRIVCERSVYNNARTWGHNSIGSPLPGPAWTLPEGSTAGGMETWVLVQNPNSETAHVNVFFMTDKGLVEPPSLQGIKMKAFSRQSFNVGNYVNSYEVSTGVVSDKPVVCERSMYGNDHVWAHNSIGYMLGLGNPYAPVSTSAATNSNAANTTDFMKAFPCLYPR